MLAYQTMKASDGKEVCLFPFEYLYMSQDEGGDFSHEGTYNIDFLGYGSSGRILNCPFYAPCTLKCVAIWDVSNNNRVYESVQPVHLADGSIDYLTICFAHDDNPLYNVGDTINQGQILGHTGTYGEVTGDHTHTCCGKGRYNGYTQRSSGHWDLTNRCHYWDATYVNDTNIVQGYNHTWKTFTDPRYGDIKSTHFPWVLYTNKIRKRNNK